MSKWKATGHIGLFWKGPDIDLGTYRWFWVAWLRTRWWIKDWRYSRATIERHLTK